jgi:hypothetical protein
MFDSPMIEKQIQSIMRSKKMPEDDKYGKIGDILYR